MTKLKECKIEIKRQIHKVYKELEEAKSKGVDIKPIMGKWQYIFSSPKGEISMIQLLNYFYDGEVIWEIYEISDNNLFEDVERFGLSEDAIKRIFGLLE